MRVAYVSADPGVPAFGRKGCSIHVQEVIRALRAHGARVELFTVRTGGAPPPDLADVPVHPLPPLAAGDGPARERLAQALNGPLAGALRAAGPFDLVYERYSLWSHAAMTEARRAGWPGVLEVNAPLIDEQEAHRELHDRGGALESRARAFGAASALVCVSAEVAAWAVAAGAPAERVRVLPNGVDLARFAPAPSPRAGTDFTVGFVGTLKPWHGVDTLIGAVGRLARRSAGDSLGRPRLLVIGDGPERARLERAAAAAGLAGAARFAGAVDHSAVPGLLAGVDVAVAPYPDLPGFYFSPLKIYEYLAAGLAVVASRVGQIEQLIEHAIDGLLCPPGDELALASALAELRRDPARRRALGEAGRARALAAGGWSRVAAQILALAPAGGVRA